MRCDILSVAQMGRADALTIEAGTPGIDLMLAAGRAVAEAIRARWAPREVLVLCGPGNNGGDGFVIAHELAQAGWSVTVAGDAPTDGWRGDAGQARELWQAGCAQRDGASTLLTLADARPTAGTLVVDALFGAGLNRPLEGDAQRALQRTQQVGATVVAVDVPSGVWGDSGLADGAVPCALTVKIGRAHV